jgi:histidine triad (HIT) family protein
MAEEKTLFSRIIDREIPADVVYEDDDCLAFKDVDPQAPVHVLVVPKKPIASIATASDVDADLLGHLLIVVRDLAAQLQLDSGFRVVINSGPDGGQSVDHLHLHLLGKRSLTWPPG